MSEKNDIYCPHCNLKLLPSGNGHIDENEAWGRFECEYDARSSNSKPVPAREILEESLFLARKRAKKINGHVRDLERRIEAINI